MSLQSLFSLTGKTALIAGASRGIGLAIAREIAQAGAHTILASRSLDKLEAEAGRLRGEGFSAEAHVIDMADMASIEKAGGALADRVDILVNVSGTNIRKRMEEYSQEDYKRILDTNLHGIFRLSQLIGEGMLNRGKGGKVVHIGSLMSLLGLPYLAVYAISKAGLAGLTRVQAAEWGASNIQVNCIAPGFIITDLNRDMWQAQVMKDWLKGVQANPEPGAPQDIAGLAVFLCSPASNYVTGQVIAADGGYTTTAVWPFAPAS